MSGDPMSGDPVNGGRMDKHIQRLSLGFDGSIPFM